APGAPGPSAVSTDAGNLLKLGTDDLILLDPADVPGGGGSQTIQTATLTAIDGTGTIALAPSFTILSVTYSAGTRLRLYRTDVGRIDDAGRAFTAPYMGGSGLLYDYLALGAETDTENPVDGAWGAGETQIYYRVTGPVDISIRWVQTGAV